MNKIKYGIVLALFILLSPNIAKANDLDSYRDPNEDLYVAGTFLTLSLFLGFCYYIAHYADIETGELPLLEEDNEYGYFQPFLSIEDKDRQEVGLRYKVRF